MRAALLMLLFLWAVPPRATAQDTMARDAEARAHYDAGELAFSSGHYEDAMRSFERAYELSGRPELLYNLGTSADRLRRDADALEFFEAYLHERPEAPNAVEVRARIEVLRSQLDTASSAPNDTTDGFTVSPSPRGGSPGPWVLAGVGALVLGGGAVLVGVAATDVAAVEGAPRGSSWADYRDAYERSEGLSIAGFVSIGLGAALAVGGLVWGLLDDGGDDDAERAMLRVTPWSLSLEGAF